MITFIMNKTFKCFVEMLIDFKVDLKYINEGVLPKKYFSKTIQGVRNALDQPMKIQLKFPDAAVLQDGVCFKTPFVMVKGLSHAVVGTFFY